MTTFLFFLVLISVAVLVSLLRVVRLDGYGHRPPPPSHHPYWPLPYGTRLP